MAGNVQSISRPEELGEFFDYMFGDMEGYAYSPTKDPSTGSFEQYFYFWPTERKELIQHVQRHSPTKEVYFGPGLFGSPKATKPEFKCTQFVWAEFDGTVPEHPEVIPDLKIKSSTDGHEHWYWRLEGPEADQDALQSVTRRLAYHLGADMASWNSNRVLRPPFTMHHESNRMVHVLRWDYSKTHSLQDFHGLPEIPIPALQIDEIGDLPPTVQVIAKYHWPTEEFSFFMEDSIPTGKRSSALTRLGHVCMELKDSSGNSMSNEEALSIMTHADNRWKKYVHREDQRERLIGIINYVRSLHPISIEEETSSRLKVYTFEEFINTDLELEWVIPELLHKKGVLALSGPRGTGKSQLTLRFAERLAKGKSFLRWHIDQPMKTLFVSMEMPHEELLHFMRTMDMEEDEELRNNMLLMPVGGSVKLNSKLAQEQLNKVIEHYQPEGIFFDSLGKGIGKDLSSDEVIFETMEYVDETLRREYGCFCWFIHHPRKAQVGNKKPNSIDDLYGNAYFANAVSTAVGLWGNGGDIDVDCLKLRLSKEFPSFQIRRTSRLDFEIASTPLNGALEQSPTTGIGIDI